MPLKATFTPALNAESEASDTETSAFESDNSDNDSLSAIEGESETLEGHLPFESHHKLLSNLQQLLELSCYNYAEKNLPIHWECPEAVELKRGTHELFKYRRRFMGSHTRSWLKTFFKSIDTIRDTAVHRRWVDVSTIEDYLSDAEDFAKLLADEATARRISHTKKKVLKAIESLERGREIQRKVEAKNQEVAQLEEEKADMERESEKYKDSATRRIDKAIVSISTIGNDEVDDEESEESEAEDDDMFASDS